MIVECAVFLATFIFLLFVYHYVTLPAYLPPGPTPLPLIGNLHNIAGSVLHLTATRLAKIYGDIFTLHIFGQRLVFINSGAVAREALMGKKINDFAGRPSLFTIEYLTRGFKDIVGCDYNSALIWRRKIVHSGLRMYFPTLEGKVTQELTKLEKRLKKKTGAPIDSKDDFTLLVLNIICSILCGKAYDMSDPEFSKMLEFNTKVAQLFLQTSSILDVFPWIVHFPLKSCRLLKYVRNTRDEVLGKIFEEHKDTFRGDVIRDLTDAFLKAKLEIEREDKKAVGEVTDDHLVMLMNDVFLAGLETTTTTIRWSVAYLLHYPHVQARAQAEIHDVIGDRWPSLSDRHNLPYVEAFIAEVLRISSIVPLGIPHKATCDSSLMGYAIPKDTTILLNIWALHHDPNEWENPDDFNPSRFIRSDGKFEVPTMKSFLPFSLGRRVCIGESLAKSELFLILSRLLQQFTFQCPPNVDLPDLEGEVGTTHYPKQFMFCVKARNP